MTAVHDRLENTIKSEVGRAECQDKGGDLKMRKNRKTHERN